MPRGAPDYSNVRAGDTLQRETDLAEIPGRLLCPTGIDRGGNIVFVEDFRVGAGSVLASTKGLGETTGLSAKYSRYGAFTYKLTRVADTTSWSGMQMFAPIIETGKIGLEVQFSSTTADPNMKFYIARYTGEDWVLWGLRWDATEDKIYIGGDTAGWLEIVEGYDIFQQGEHYHNAKFVVDVDDKNYARVIIDGKNIPVLEKAAHEEENDNSPHVVIDIYTGIGPTTVSEVYIDYVMVTRNEY